MTPEDFRSWRKSHGLKQKDAATLLGLKKRMIQYYEKGERDGNNVAIPRAVRLACYALSQGIVDFDGKAEERGAITDYLDGSKKKPKRAETPTEKPVAKSVKPASKPVKAAKPSKTTKQPDLEKQKTEPPATKPEDNPQKQRAPKPSTAKPKPAPKKPLAKAKPTKKPV